jgi:hypothetical protein
MTGSAMGQRQRQTKALPWIRKRADGPFDPVTFSAAEPPV